MTRPDDASLLKSLLRPDAPLRREEEGIYSVLAPDADGTAYDARAAAYDRVVGSELYNRLLWGVSRTRYEAFVRAALEDGTGPLLDAGAGSAVFTAGAYARTTRPVLLVDRAQGMLRAARERLARRAEGTVPENVALLQGDLETLPLREGEVDTVLSMGMLHLFEDAVAHVEHLLSFLAPGGALFATSLVAERFVGRQYLRLLHAAGEVASPRTYDELRKRLAALDCDLESTRDGSMAFFVVRTAS